MKIKALRRTVRQKFVTGDLISFETKSFTRKDETKYHPTIDVQTGESHCDCPTSVYRPTLVCKHRIRAGLNLIRKGQLDPAWLQRTGKKLCHKCGSHEQLFGVCEITGKPREGVYICFSCVEAVRAEYIYLTPQEVAANAQIEPFEESPDEHFERLNAEVDLLEDDLRIMEETGASRDEIEGTKTAIECALDELSQAKIPSRFSPDTYEEMRRYLQWRVNMGEYVHGNDFDRYQLVERET